MKGGEDGCKDGMIVEDSFLFMIGVFIGEGIRIMFGIFLFMDFIRKENFCWCRLFGKLKVFLFLNIRSI